ncbi:MAG: GFA family protein [Proteobacteria bacterium]|nr:GFA family protein [Pseudomonadota bacterium]
MLKTREASCTCGQLKLVAKGDPLRVSICHCFACQTRTGSTYGVQARFKATQITITGKTTEYVRIGDEGSKITYSFCPSCGSTLFYKNDQLEGSIVIPIGAFKDPTFPKPETSIYEERRHHWVLLPEGMDHLD